MTVQRDSERTAASAGNIDDTAYWGIVDKLGTSVKMTLAQLKTHCAAVTSITGDITATVVSGVATTAIGALKVVTGMFANAAVTYAKIQNVSATSRLLGRYSTGAGSIEEVTPSTTYFTTADGTLRFAAPTNLNLVPIMLANDIACIGTAYYTVSWNIYDSARGSGQVLPSGQYLIETMLLYVPGINTNTGVTDIPYIAWTNVATHFALSQWGRNGTTTTSGTPRVTSGEVSGTNRSSGTQSDSGEMHMTTMVTMDIHVGANPMTSTTLRLSLNGSASANGGVTQNPNWTLKAGSWVRLTLVKTF